MVREEVLDGMETVLSLVSEHDEIVYADVTGVTRDHLNVVVTPERVRHGIDVETSGIGIRVFVNGAVGYRFVTVLTSDNLSDALDKAVRATRNLAQSTPARYDPNTVHRATHSGWARPDESLSRLSADDAGSTVRSALDGVDFGEMKRVRVTYDGDHLERAFMSSTGTTLRTTLDRSSAETAVDLPDGRRVTDHAGATTGSRFLSSLPEHLSTVAGQVRRAANRPTTRPSTGERDLVLGPRAAGQLFHAVAHYLEADMVFFGSSPFAEGARIGPPSLTVEDTVRPGSWTALAFDAEGRPTHSTTLVDRGEIVGLLHDTVSAADMDVMPHGHVVPSVGDERPPRIHARHLDVEAGETPIEALLDGSAAYVERLGPPTVGHEATRSKRESTMPPSVQYAKDVAEGTPDAYGDESENQRIEFPVQLGYDVVDGTRGDAIVDATLEFELGDLRTIEGLSPTRETVSGTCVKHESRLPFAVTAPAVRLRGTVA